MDVQMLAIKGMNALHTVGIVDAQGMLTRTALMIFSIIAIVGGIVLVVDAVKHIRQAISEGK